MRTRFICSVENEAVLKLLFKEDDDTLTFTRAVELASETEDAAQVAKETIYGSEQQSKPVYAVRKKQQETSITHEPERKPADSSKGKCIRCGYANHKASECRFKETTCNYCKKKGHLE